MVRWEDMWDKSRSNELPFAHHHLHLWFSAWISVTGVGLCERLPLWVFMCVSKWLLPGTDDCNLHNGLTSHTDSDRARADWEIWRGKKKKYVLQGKGFCGAAAKSKLDLLLVVTQGKIRVRWEIKGPTLQPFSHLYFSYQTPMKQPCTIN